MVDFFIVISPPEISNYRSMPPAIIIILCAISGPAFQFRILGPLTIVKTYLKQ
jgi:hypothetical protein